MTQPDGRPGTSTRSSPSTDSPYRVGPWPGLTARGAWVLVGYAGLLWLGVLAAGSPRQPLPDLPLLGFVSCVPLLMATRVTRVPGAASAVCGAYLLPRTLLSLCVANLEPPPLLLVPTLAMDAVVWLRASDLRGLGDVLPRRRFWRRRRTHTPRDLQPIRASIGGGVYALLLSAVVPPWAVLLGGTDPTTWAGPPLWLGAVAAALVCALEGWLIVRSGLGLRRRAAKPADRGTGW